MDAPALVDESPKPKKEKKKPPEGLVIPPKKPKLSKAERRALQEAQRAAKAGKQGGASGKKPAEKAAPSQSPAADNKVEKSTEENDQAAKKPSISIVSHLPMPSLEPPKTDGSLHPAVVALGHKYSAGEIRGGNARCLAMLSCLETVFADYEPPTDQLISSDLVQTVLKPSFQYWTQCRPHSVTMGNAFAFVKAAVATLDRQAAWHESREILSETLEQYRREHIEFADLAISELAISKLQQQNSAEVILVYGYSQVVTLTLLEYAKQSGSSDFRVIVADSGPLREGRQTLQALREANVDCTYVLLNALTYVMQDVTKVLLGAAALYCDGSVLGRVGTAGVALQAHAAHLPVLILSESYKISNRVQLESITHNELGPTDESLQDTPYLNLLYDLTPAAFVSGIVTELGIVPPTSVAVLLREMNQGTELS